MTLQRLAARCLVTCVVLGALVVQAAAHGSEDVPVGTVTVPPGGVATIVMAHAGPGDRLSWGWHASAPELVSVQVLWHDQGGREYTLSPEETQQPFGTFVAPAAFNGARLVWRNVGDAPV